MNVANLQLEGLVMALASLNQLLVRKGLVSIDEIERTLHRAEADLTSEERAWEDMSPANRDALCFPVRVLQARQPGAVGRRRAAVFGAGPHGRRDQAALQRPDVTTAAFRRRRHASAVP